MQKFTAAKPAKVGPSLPLARTSDGHSSRQVLVCSEQALRRTRAKRQCGL